MIELKKNKAYLIGSMILYRWIVVRDDNTVVYQGGRIEKTFKDINEFMYEFEKHFKRLPMLKESIYND